MRHILLKTGGLGWAVATLTASVGLAQPAGIKNQDVGLPTLPGSYTATAGKLTIKGGGNDIWGSADNFHYAYITVTGNFDYVVKVEDLQGPDNWSKAELMAREGNDDGAGGLFLDGSDRHISNMTTRSGGQNEIALQWRSDAPGSGSAWPNDIGIAAPLQRPTYPNTWLRLERVGSKFWGYASSDGTTWTLLRGSPYDFLALNGNEAALRTSGTMANKLALGLAVTAHNDGDANGATAVFSDFKPFTPLPIAVVTPPPATLAVAANSTLTLSIVATGDPLHYQWRKDGTDIPGANTATYTKSLCQPSDAGSYTVQLYGAGQTTVVSPASTVTVTADVTPPTLVSAVASDRFVNVLVAFSEPVTQASAEATANYQINGLTVTAARLYAAPNDYRVLLTTTAQTPGTEYTLAVQNVRDSSGNPVAAGTSIKFRALLNLRGGLKFEAWYNIPNTPVQGLLDDPRYPDSPDLIGYVTQFSSRQVFPDASHENYGARLSGWLVPTETAQYELFIRSDDASQLWLSPDDKPENAVMIAEETGCCGPFEDNADATAPHPETSAPIALTAGKRYAIFALWKEGGGGDYCDVAWRKVGDPAVPRNLPYIPGSVLEAVAAPDTFTFPTLAFTAPADNSTFDTNVPVTLTVTAAAAPGKTIARVEFFELGKLLGQALAEPYSLTLTNLTADPHKIIARATDSVGLYTEAGPITVNIGKPTEQLVLLAINDQTTWRYDRSGDDLGTAWRNLAFNDSAWPQGKALIADETTTTVEPIRTPISRFNDAGTYVKTFYFRGKFTFDRPVGAWVKLQLRHVVDDGAVFYLNGTEVHRFGIAAGPVDATTDATGHENAYEGPYDLPANLLVRGENILTAEVHQSGGSSSDMVFGAELIATIQLVPKQIDLVKIDDQTTWRYDRSAEDLGTAWREKAFNDSAWPSGKTLIADESTTTVEPIRTPISRFNDAGTYVKTFYFRTHFNLPGATTTGARLKLRHVVDDGVIFYLNGVEIHRFGIAAGPVDATTDATGHENAYEGPYDIPIDNLVPGDNVLAAEVHQSGGSSSDMVFGAELVATVLVPDESGPAPTFTSAVRAAGNITLQWTGGGTLQAADVVTGPYADVAGASTPYTTPAAGTARFYRLRQ